MRNVSEINDTILVASSYETKVKNEDQPNSETESEKSEIVQEKHQNSCTLTSELISAHETEHNLLNNYNNSYYESIC